MLLKIVFQAGNMKDVQDGGQVNRERYRRRRDSRGRVAVSSW